MGTIILTLLGGLGGSLLTLGYNSLRNRLQIMQCHYLEDDVLSKIPQRNEDDTICQNVHFKRFQIKNTTNKDIADFKVLFQFDATSKIMECYSKSKEGFNRQKIRVSKHNKNEAEAFVRNFNRGDAIEYFFQIANIKDNSYYVTECNCTGFKIRCKDKRRNIDKSKSKLSSQILITRH